MRMEVLDTSTWSPDEKPTKDRGVRATTGAVAEQGAVKVAEYSTVELEEL
jgi:hypothetical protein